LKVFEQQDAGYAMLLSRHGRDPDLPWRRSAIRSDTRPRESHLAGRQLVETFPASYHRGDDDYDHLVFALKYDGFNPWALAKIFAHVDEAELARRIAAQPTSQYARRLFFLYERLTARRLDLDDATQGAWVPAIDPDTHFTAAGIRSHRHRVLDNLLGDHEFCPVVRRTPTLTEAITKRLDERAAEIARNVEPELLARAIAYLYTKETKSSFAIEREEPGDRMARYVQQLATVGRLPLDTRAGLVELQHSLVDPRYAEHDFRGPGDLEVYVGETVGFRERVHHHHIGAPSAVTPSLMNGWLRMREVEGEGGAVIEAACRSFAFVFIHPFGDGNGRIHRLLLHHVLARRGFTPDRFIIPISSVLHDDPRSYDEALEAFSRTVMLHTRYRLDAEGELTIVESDPDFYRFPDLTVQTEATFAWLERAIEEHLVDEIEFLRRFEEVRDRMREIVEMPDRKEQLFITLCRHNGGVLSKRKRSKFAELDDETVAALEAVIREVMDRPRPPRSRRPPGA
jgi:hypothetical protein